VARVIVEVPAENLKVGIYVSRLDRPWTDAPFLFQGFVIENEEQVEILRRLCKVVHVEVTETEALELKTAKRVSTNSKPAPSASDTTADPWELLTVDPAALVDRVPIKDAVPLQHELETASVTFGEAKRTVGALFHDLRRGGGLDMPQLDAIVGSMVDSVLRNREAMGWLARMRTKDDYLYSHSLAASVWAMAFGRHLGLDKDTLKAVGTGAMMLDIGKTQLPTELLRKSGQPTDAEWEMIREHVNHGVEMLRRAPHVDERVVTMVATHHERHDGSGYPNKLKADEIPLIGRIAGIVDCYDAMISDRKYARPKSPFAAVRELKQLGGVTFSPQLVELFIQAVGVFPTGTIVELNTGEVGVVIGQNRFRRLRPEIMVILDADKKVREEFATINLLTCAQNSASKEPTLWITAGLEAGAYGIDPTEYFL
jgi:putative nucleotidyltransferase with HDIG domain